MEEEMKVKRKKERDWIESKHHTSVSSVFFESFDE